MLKAIMIIRPLNLLLIALGQALIHHTLLIPLRLPLAMGHAEWLILLLSTLSIAAGGNIINDIMDLEVDKVNKPEKLVLEKAISIKAAYNLYMVLTAAGVVGGLVLSNMLDVPGLAAIFVLVAALLYWYSTQLKGIMLAGNVLVSLLVAVCLLIVPVFDLYPAAPDGLSSLALRATSLVFHLSVFAFGLNLVREIVKDIQDVNGDRKGGHKTLPIVLGRETAGLIALGLTLLLLAGLMIYAYRFLYSHQMLLIYAVLVLAPMLVYIGLRLKGTQKPAQLKLTSRLLKAIMFLGVVAIPFLKMLIE